MSEVPRTQEELIDPEDQEAPIELDDKDILAVEPATPALRPTAGQIPRPRQVTDSGGLKSAEDILRLISGKLSGVGSIGTAHDDDSDLDFTRGGKLVKLTEPNGGTVTLDEVSAIERRATQKLKADREAAKTPEQRAATERAIKSLKRLGSQPPSAQLSTEPIIPTRPRTPAGSPKNPKDRLIERLKKLQARE